MSKWQFIQFGLKWHYLRYFLSTVCFTTLPLIPVAFMIPFNSKKQREIGNLKQNKFTKWTNYEKYNTSEWNNTIWVSTILLPILLHNHYVQY